MNSKQLFAFLLATLFVCISRAQNVDIDVPKCGDGMTDPGTEKTCGRLNSGTSIVTYGYDKVWTVYTKVVGANKYIAVQVTDGGTTPADDPYSAFWPPPPVEVNLNQRIRIKLINRLGTPSDRSEKVTLHFHGILQSGGYNTMDGPQGITQSPVLYGDSFTYDFPANHAGTFWVHSHATGQYPKGLRSALIVRDINDVTTLTYNKDLDFTVTVSDWWANFYATLDSYTVNKCGPGVELPAERIIVNDNAVEWGHPVLDDGLSYLVPPGEKARFRFINVSAFQRFYIHLDTKDNNDMVVVEVDGVLTKNLATSGIELSSGQRVSVIITGAPLGTPDSNGKRASRKIIFVGDPRVSIPGVPNCPATYNTPEGRSPSGKTQYAWAWIDNVNAASAVRKPPTEADLTYSVNPLRNDIDIWTDNDSFGIPYFSKRPKLPFTYSSRNEKINVVRDKKNVQIDVTIPEYAYNFNELAMEPRTSEPAWMIDSWRKDENSIHAILLNDTNGPGTMNVRRYGLQGAKTAGFPRTELDLDKSQASQPDFRRQHSLMQILRSDNARVVPNNPYQQKYYQVPETYSARTHPDNSPVDPWSHNIVINPSVHGEIHWFVLRSKRGDHPFHMHGHEFQLLSKIPTLTNPNYPYWPYDFNFGASGTEFYSGIYDQVLRDRGAGKPQPVRRDTLFIEKGWDYVIAMRADNPGAWAMHCHNDFHADTGMFMQLIENPKKLRQDLGTWDVDVPQGGCGTCKLPWFSRSGAVSMRNQLGGAVWGPLAQTLRYSM